MQIFQRALTILKQPRAFFRRLDEKSLVPAWVYYAVFSLIVTVLGVIVQYYTTPVSAGLMARLFNIPAAGLTAAASLGFGWMVFTSAIGYVFRLGAIFITIAILYAWIYIFGGRASYTRTFQLGVYSNTPSYLLGWIPFVGWIGGIWSLVLLIIGTQEVHKLSRLKSILMYVIPVAILLIIWTTSVVFLAIMSRAVPGMYAA